MSNSINYQERIIQFERYPKTNNRSLLAYSNAELLAIDYCSDKQFDSLHLFNDRFGVWSATYCNANVTAILNYASQKKAIQHNFKLNQIDFSKVNIVSPIKELNRVELALVKVPKSLELFELYLQQIHKASNDNTEVVCAFMTKYFNASLLKIASKYFEEVSQTKAWKKARLLILKFPKKEVEYKELINAIDWNGETLKQYYGVFSSSKVDIGTQFLLETIQLASNENSVLDLASGNGIIAFDLQKRNPDAKFTLVDDSLLAVASSKLNLVNEDTVFICDDTLEVIEDTSLDLVVSNPPFHFEHETNIEVSLHLFKQVAKCLKASGRFVLVANKHLNYTTHLIKAFKSVEVLDSNQKFEVLECRL